MKLFYLMGKSASGKDTIYKKLMEREGLSLKALVPYTTRPIRSGEVDGKDYHFSTVEELESLKEAGRVIEHRTYHTVHGDWHYFTVAEISREEAVKNAEQYIAIGTPESYGKILEYYGKEICRPIYICLDDGERLSRALTRERSQKEPKYKELCRRFLADDEDFREEVLKELQIDRQFENNDLEETVENIASYITQE